MCEKKYDLVIQQRDKIQIHLRLSKLSAYKTIKANLEMSNFLFVTQSKPIEQTILESIKNAQITLRNG